MFKRAATQYNLLWAVFLLLGPAPLTNSAWCQSDFAMFLNPRPNDFSAIGGVESTFYGKQDVEDEDAEVEAFRLEGRVRLMLGKPSSDEWVLSLDALAWDLDSDAHFDESGKSLPDDLQNYAMGITYRRFLDNDWMWGQHLRLGSASDEPFHSPDEMYVKGTTFLRIPSGDANAWLFLLDLDTNREFPVLPGVAYQYVFNRQLWVVVGIPVFALGWQATESIQVDLSYLPLKNVNASTTWRLTDPLKMRLAFEWRSDYFKRADRDEWDDRIEVEEKRGVIGFEYSFTEQLSLGLEGGYAFGREIGEGDSWDDRRENNIEIEDSWFGGIKLNWRI